MPTLPDIPRLYTALAEVLAALLYAWLFFGGYWLVKGITAWMA